MYMTNCVNRLAVFLLFNEEGILSNKGKIYQSNLGRLVVETLDDLVE